MDQDTPVKYCSDCKTIKPLTEFVLNKRRPDGRGTYCRACFNVRSRHHREQLAANEGREVKRKREVAPGMKYCPRCRQELPVEAFGSNRSSRDGRTAYCRPCHNSVGLENRQRLYGSSRDYHLRRRYGITAADVDAMIAAQGNTCAVCSGKPEHVDHDHVTGKVRGILCFNCNQALGNARDNPKVLRGLAGYLEAHSERDLQLVVDQTYRTGPSELEAHLRRHLAS